MKTKVIQQEYKGDLEAGRPKSAIRLEIESLQAGQCLQVRDITKGRAITLRVMASRMSKTGAVTLRTVTNDTGVDIFRIK